MFRLAGVLGEDFATAEDVIERVLGEGTGLPGGEFAQLGRGQAFHAEVGVQGDGGLRVDDVFGRLDSGVPPYGSSVGVSGLPLAHYTIETSTDLVHRSLFTNVQMNSQGVRELGYLVTTNEPQRYFRVR